MKFNNQTIGRSLECSKNSNQMKIINKNDIQLRFG